VLVNELLQSQRRHLVDSDGESQYEGKPQYVTTADTWGKADIHIHSNHSDGTASIPQIMEYVQQHTELDVIAITDHNTIEGALFAQSLAELYDFEVIVGEEVTSQEGHILGLYLTEAVPAGMSARDTVKAIEAQGGIAIVAHPFSNQGVFGPFGRNLFADAVNDWAFHALEIYNSLPFLVWANSIAAKMFAGGHGIAATGGSDAHYLQAVGKGFTIFRGTTADDLKRSILNLETRADSKPQGLSFVWRLARNYPRIRQLQELNRDRCKAGRPVAAER
jgi:predicted metal-dependent phosphoesterase TrpH